MIKFYKIFKLKSTNIRNFGLLFAFFAIFLLGCNNFGEKNDQVSSQNNIYESIWGDNESGDSLIDDLHKTKIMQRLKNVDQAGPAHYLHGMPPYSRYSHSIGVFVILKKFGCNQNEQAAGLFHDISHTAFSHVGDYVFSDDPSKYTKNSFQDSIHMQYLRKHRDEIDPILKKYNISFDVLNPENKEYRGLEQKLPDMCADRIEYNIHTGLIMKKINREDAKQIVDDLRFEGGVWFFKSLESARKFARLSVMFTKEFWGSEWNTSMNIHFAGALKRALDINLISRDELFGDDIPVLQKLENSKDRIIKKFMRQCRNILQKMKGYKYKKIHFTPKFRGVDPLVKTDGMNDFKRLSEIDDEFKRFHDDVKGWCEKGFDLYILT